jgi:hypothetical protein
MRWRSHIVIEPQRDYETLFVVHEGSGSLEGES